MLSRTADQPRWWNMRGRGSSAPRSHCWLHARTVKGRRCLRRYNIGSAVRRCKSHAEAIAILKSVCSSEMGPAVQVFAQLGDQRKA
jgi:hypothetical protein